MKKFVSFVTGVLMGSLVGATAALLLAPTTGDELRGQLKGKMNTLREELSEAMTASKVELEKKLEDLRNPSGQVTME